MLDIDVAPFREGEREGGREGGREGRREFTTVVCVQGATTVYHAEELECKLIHQT